MLLQASNLRLHKNDINYPRPCTSFFSNYASPVCSTPILAVFLTCFSRVFGELSQVEISLSDEVSAIKNAYVEAAGEIEANSRTFTKYNQRGAFYPII